MTSTKNASIPVVPTPTHIEAISEGGHSCHSPLTSTAPSVQVPSSVYIRTSTETTRTLSSGEKQATKSNESFLGCSTSDNCGSSNTALVSHVRRQAPPAAPTPAAIQQQIPQDPSVLAQALLTMCSTNPELLVQQNELVIKDLLILFGGDKSSRMIPSISTAAGTGVVEQQETAAQPGAQEVPTQKENSKTNSAPGSRKVACRARGMPPDHCSQSAYFYVHPDLPHGADLLCCYPSCRAAGVKFRYCSVCQVPAAKRSFLFRHSHNHAARSPSKSPPAGMEQNTLLSEKQAAPVNGPSAPTKKRRTNSGGPPSSVSASSGSEDNSSQDPKESEWMQLLKERPDDNDEDRMSRWLLRAMHISKSIQRGTEE
eukprot:Nitzschia sp. Nitz4//scaffold175_size95217//85700//86897//NITZ4_004738-RA/size95217-exonerate_est2genome-gene-0.38-mRNA-1//1//CDS//3329538984//4899//frame0